MSDADALVDRLQYDVMEQALRLDNHPSAAEMDEACRTVWSRVVATRFVETPMTFDAFRALFQATMRRCPDLASRPRTLRSAA